jgi:hypothetical protein
MEQRLAEDLARLDAGLWQVLRQASVRVAAHPKPTIDVPEAEIRRLLEPFQQALLTDLAYCREILRQAYLLGVRRIQTSLDGHPLVDSDLLDEVVEFELRKAEGEDGAAVPL